MLKFTGESSKTEKVYAAIMALKRADLKLKQVFISEGVELMLVTEEEEKDSYGDMTNIMVVDTPIGMYRFLTETSYGTWDIQDVIPVKPIITTEYEYDNTPRVD